MQEQGQTLYRPIYVHAKTTIVDDVWLTLGSANLNNRGMHDDTEMNVAIVHPEMAQRLRILLMVEHLGLCDEDQLFRLLETVGQVQSDEDYKKSETFYPLSEAMAMKAATSKRCATLYNTFLTHYRTVYWRTWNALGKTRRATW